MSLTELSKQRQAAKHISIEPELLINTDTQTMHLLDAPVSFDKSREDYIGALTNTRIYDLRADFNALTNNYVNQLTQQEATHKQDTQPKLLTTLRRVGTQISAGRMDRQLCYIQLENLIDIHAASSWLNNTANNTYKTLTNPINAGLAQDFAHGASTLAAQASNTYDSLERRMRVYGHDIPDTLSTLTERTFSR